MRPICSLLCLLAISACAPDKKPSNVEGSLNALGVDTTSSAPLGPGGVTLQPDDAPLGGKATVDKVDEVALVGVPAAGSSDTFRVLDTDVDGNVTTMTSSAPDWTTATWHTTAATDLDGDGKDEVVGVALEDGALVLHWTHPGDAGWTDDSWRLGSITADLTGLAAAGGDVTGDGVGDLVIAASHAGSADIYVVAGSATGPSLAGQFTVDAHHANANLDVKVATGQLDVDNALEMALAVNEQGGASWFQVRDDANAGFAVLDEGDVLGADPSTGQVTSALTANVAIGDFDGDGLDEVALGGLANFVSSCDEEEQTVLEVLDDAVRDFAVLGRTSEHHQWRPCASEAPWRMSMVTMSALDLDGDGIDEIQLNDVIYDDLAAGPLAVTWQLPADAVFPVGDTHGGWWDAADVSTATGDVNQDGREDLVLYNQNVRPSLTTWGIRGPGGQEGFGLVRSEDTASPIGDPQVVTANVDDDSVVVSYDKGTYALVFTEPVILAVLSAPPCYPQQGRNGSCTTAWGQSTTTGSTEGYALRTEASATVGFKAGGEVLGVGLEAEGTLTAMQAMSARYERSYELTKTVTYTTGSMEDAVVFTTIPYDQYTYTILTDPDPSLVGTQVVVSLPRKPITLIADRDFYNAHVVDGATKIDGNYLQHTVGDPTTYPTVSEKNQWLGDGLQSDLVTVGVGEGETAVDLDVSTAVSTGGSMETGFTTDLKVTGGGVIAGFSVGATAESSLMLTSGTGTTYHGAVGSLSSSDFDTLGYSFGMFTYVDADNNGREFEVLNYWVE